MEQVVMISCGEHFVLDFKQYLASDDKYVKALCAQFNQFAIEYQASEVISFITPGDSVIKRDRAKKNDMVIPDAINRGIGKNRSGKFITSSLKNSYGFPFEFIKSKSPMEIEHLFPWYFLDGSIFIITL